MKNLFSIFVSPEETFRRVRDNSKTAWIIPFVVLTVAYLVITYLQMPMIEDTVRETLQKNPKIDPSSYDALVAGSMITAWVTAVLTPALTIFVGALLYMLLNLIVRGEAKYMQLATMASYATLPGLLGGLINMALLLSMDAQSVTDVNISLAAFVSDHSSSLYRLLSLTNPFSIWALALYVIGASIMMKRSKKKVGMWIVGTWLVFSVGGLLLS